MSNGDKILIPWAFFQFLRPFGISKASLGRQREKKSFSVFMLYVLRNELHKMCLCICAELRRIIFRSNKYLVNFSLFFLFYPFVFFPIRLKMAISIAKRYISLHIQCGMCRQLLYCVFFCFPYFYFQFNELFCSFYRSLASIHFRPFNQDRIFSSYIFFATI